jgi:hypothetical protein
MTPQSKNCRKSNDLDDAKIITETWKAITKCKLKESGKNLS